MGDSGASPPPLPAETASALAGSRAPWSQDSTAFSATAVTAARVARGAPPPGRDDRRRKPGGGERARGSSLSQLRPHFTRAREAKSPRFRPLRCSRDSAGLTALGTGVRRPERPLEGLAAGAEPGGAGLRCPAAAGLSGHPESRAVPPACSRGALVPRGPRVPGARHGLQRGSRGRRRVLVAVGAGVPAPLGLAAPKPRNPFSGSCVSSS